MSDENANDEAGGNAQIGCGFFAALVLFVLLTIVILTNENLSLPFATLGGFAKFLLVAGAAVLGIPFGVLGYVIGGKVREAIIPDAVFTQGVENLIKAKIFWAIGPQLIGAVIGLGLGSLPAVAIGAHVNKGRVAVVEAEKRKIAEETDRKDTEKRKMAEEAQRKKMEAEKMRDTERRKIAEEAERKKMKEKKEYEKKTAQELLDILHAK
ncbi:MAG: hypothetical protein LBP75_03205 [Planctomycetota bacterium]|jgi:signal transduction histidine kinase|nr:hypothetical protein [Planctomycetota bacterium]